MVHWLYHLLLQPDSQLQDWPGRDIPGSDKRSSSSNGRSMDAVVRAVIEHDLDGLGLSFAPAQREQPSKQPTGSDSSADEVMLKALRVAGLRAMAAGYLLSCAIAQHRVEVVSWLLGCWQSMQYGDLVEACFVAQQRLAWAGLTGSLQVPLLMMAAAAGAPGELFEVRLALAAWLVKLIWQLGLQYREPFNAFCSV
jgi:hypothetical protein